MKYLTEIFGQCPPLCCCTLLDGFSLCCCLAAVLSEKMFVFDGLSGLSRTVRLRPRQPSCAVCGDSPSVTALIDYRVFCGSAESCGGPVILSVEDRISCQDYQSIRKAGTMHMLLDVRQKTEFEICHIDDAIRILFISGTFKSRGF